MQDRFSDEDRHARYLLCVVSSIIVNRALQLDNEVEGMIFLEKDYFSTGHFRVPKTLTFKARPSAQPFLWKWVLFAWEWKIVSISKAEHLTSFWYRGPGERGNGLFPWKWGTYVDGKHSGSQQIGSFQTTCTLPITVAESEPSFSLMKWIKTFSRSKTSEERFSDLAVDRHVLLRVIRGRWGMPASLCKGSSKKALSCQSVWLKRRVKKETKNYHCCTVLLVLNNSVSNLTNLYLWNQNIENLRIQTLPSNSPLPHSFGPGMFALNSHTYNPLFEKILDPPLKFSKNYVNCCVLVPRTQPLICVGCPVQLIREVFWRLDSSSSATLIWLTLRRLLTFCLTLTN